MKPPASLASRIGRFALKELREILRDRRTIITLVLMPVLLYPILSIAFNQYFMTVHVPSETSTFRVGIASRVEHELLLRYFEDIHRDERTKVKFSGFEAPDIDGQLREGSIDVGVHVTNLEAIAQSARPMPLELEIIVIEESPLGKQAATALMDSLTRYNIRALHRRLQMFGERRPEIEISAQVRELPQITGKKTSLLSSLIPLVLVLMTITGAVYPAIDLTAGERERGTLEILMAAPIPRVGLLLAKYIAVLTVTMLTGIVNLTSMTVTVWVSGLGKVLFGESGLSLGSAAAVLGLLLLMAMFFSAVLLAVTSFARSFKEAQAYLIPLMLASITPGMISLLPGTRLGGLTTVTPLLNVVLLSKELFEGAVPAAEALIVVLSTMFYAFCAIALAARIFGAEAVLYSEQGQVADLFRRPRTARDTPSLTAALFCLAIAFPAHFLLSGSMAKFTSGMSLEGRLMLSVAVSILLFLGIPFASAWAGRVRLRTAWELRAPPALSLAAALLLGVSLWPFALQAQALAKSIGIATLPEDFHELARALIDKWRATSPAVVLLAVALVPAVVEEIFFRGYLFNAFPHREHPWRTIVVTALLFGVFHVLLMNLLAVERLIPATILGVALGWLRWRSGSVFPGMVLHAVNNSLIVIMGLYPHWFGRLASAAEASAHVPIEWLAAALPVAGAGVALAWFAGRRALAE